MAEYQKPPYIELFAFEKMSILLDILNQDGASIRVLVSTLKTQLVELR